MKIENLAIPKIKHDGLVTIAEGKNRFEKHWRNKEQSWSQILRKISQTCRTPETHEEYKKLSKTTQGEIKDVGGFVGGTLQGGRRKSDSISWRQILTLDADYAKKGFWDNVEIFQDYACAIYSTHKHSPESPRLRLVIPLARPVSTDEYAAVSRKVAADIGIDYFDDTTYEPHRLMYWPSTSSDGEFEFEYQDAAWLNPDDILAHYDNWQDPSSWPRSSRAQQKRTKLADKQGDPLAKPGLVGAFCRTYTIADALEKFLSDVYTPTEFTDRYTYIAGSTVGGLVVYEDDRFAYSHHGTDPIGGKLCNAFDLVRLHKFGELDADIPSEAITKTLPSYKEMLNFITSDEKVKIAIGEEKLAEAREVFGSPLEEDKKEKVPWTAALKFDSKGKYTPTINNIKIILKNDPNLKGKFGLNDFSHRAIILGDLPWKKGAIKKIWSDMDDSGLRHYLEHVFEITNRYKTFDALHIVMKDNSFHPVRDYLETIEWDGLDRLDRLLVDYLGAEDSYYVRTATRKTFTAAVARIMVPGIKFDYMLVLSGPQGIGKSSLITCMGKKWCSDSIISVKGKEAYEALQGYWLLELGELTATRKADVEAVKHFISKQEDVFREAYAKHTVAFPRQCIFIGSTNDKDFLRDKTGNRRFWPIDVGEQTATSNIWDGLPKEVDQVWAEAVYNWKNGESIYPDIEFAKAANEKQETHTEQSAKFGIVQEYLDRLLPENWDSLGLSERRSYIHDDDFGITQEGIIQHKRTCTMEIWMELFNGDPKYLDWQKSKEINDILRNMPKWTSAGVIRLKNYGRQRGFKRVF